MRGPRRRTPRAGAALWGAPRSQSPMSVPPRGVELVRGAASCPSRAWGAAVEVLWSGGAPRNLPAALYPAATQQASEGGRPGGQMPARGSVTAVATVWTAFKAGIRWERMAKGHGILQSIRGWLARLEKELHSLALRYDETNDQNLRDPIKTLLMDFRTERRIEK
ncbi:hypothetical protein NDU88_000691 [Pleurodeles waltl]|uniref:Uncharacterized protein n=1 Tax=Pleurodeles waltl TaxID=8319 RepID=A0AAV7LX98_PLEWA|nr:hypothetical protein NDU88_000691 [Pleurodeles waltl]